MIDSFDINTLFDSQSAEDWDSLLRTILEREMLVIPGTTTPRPTRNGKPIIP